MAAVLGHLAQLVVQGLNSVGGGGTSHAGGGDTTRRPVGGKPRNGVNRPGPCPTSPPSGGSGPGVGLGEVLQGPEGRLLAWRGVDEFEGGRDPPAVLVGDEPHGGADRWCPRRPVGPGLGPGGHGSPPWWAGRPVAFPRALRSLAGGARLYDQARPATPLSRRFDRTLRRSRTVPSRVFDPDAPCAQQPVHGCSDGDVGGAAGDLVVGAGPWARIAPGGGSRGRRGPCGARAPSADWMAPGRTASVIFGGRPVPAQRPPRSWTPGGGRFAHRHARADRADGSPRAWLARVGAVPLRYPPRRRASPPGPVGGHRSRRAPPPRSTVLAALPFLVLGRADGADPAPLAIPDDRSVQRPARVPGPLFERSGEHAISPSDHRPLPESIRSNKPSNAPQERNRSTTPAPANTSHHTISHHVSILSNQREHTDN